MKFKFGELFAGPGGIGLGAKLAKISNKIETLEIKHGWATDYDKDSCETYQRNICPDKEKSIICKDIRKLNFDVLRNISKIDSLAFGFPCNDFSIVGKQKGINGTFGPLYSFGVNAVRYFQPKWFLAENVGGLRNSNEGEAFKTILKELYESNYSIYPHLYKFEEYGIPQRRHRIIIIGIHKDLDVTYGIPSPEPFSGIENTCRKALENPPILIDASNNELTRQSDAVVERLKHIRPGENAFTANLPKHLKLNINGAKISQIYKRLDPTKPAYTVTGSGGGGTHVYHWEEPRALTNRERARLQTFPDNFIFYGSKESVRKQIGMALPVNAAKIIFEAILKSFAGIDYPKIEANIIPRIHNKNLENYNKINSGKQMFLFEDGTEYQVSSLT